MGYTVCQLWVVAKELSVWQAILNNGQWTFSLISMRFYMLVSNWYNFLVKLLTNYFISFANVCW